MYIMVDYATKRFKECVALGIATGGVGTCIIGAATDVIHTSYSVLVPVRAATENDLRPAAVNRLTCLQVHVSLETFDPLEHCRLCHRLTRTHASSVALRGSAPVDEKRAVTAMTPGKT